jgi:hypothetical protein
MLPLHPDRMPLLLWEVRGAEDFSMVYMLSAAVEESNKAVGGCLSTSVWSSSLRVETCARIDQYPAPDIYSGRERCQTTVYSSLRNPD